METIKNCFICSYFKQRVDYNDNNPIASCAGFECLAEMFLSENITLKDQLSSHSCCHVSYEMVLRYDRDFYELSEKAAMKKYLEKYFQED